MTRNAAHPRYANFRNFLRVCLSSFNFSHDVSEGIETGLKEALAFYLALRILREKVRGINAQTCCT